MESEKILMAAGISAAVMVGAFVFWGPSGASRLRQRRGQIAGLHNFGRTCFLNTLLQALAACPQFIAWLQLHNSGKDKKSMISSLLNTLEVINGTHPTLRGDPYSPGAVIRALSALGWVIPQEEHDTHELFHVMLSSIEEEAEKPPMKKVGCLSDVLDTLHQEKHVGHKLVERPSSAMLSDFLNADYDESTSFSRQVRSEVHTPDSPASVCDDNEEVASLIREGELNFSPIMQRASHCRAFQKYTHGGGDTDPIHKKNSMSCRSLERLSRGPGRVSIWSDLGPSPIPHPFQGTMGSQMICSGCGFKSTVRYDKFDSISLNLPEIKRPGLILGNLLSEYVASENILDVQCEACNQLTNHSMQKTFAKLPSCLCIQIQRTTWLPTEQISKRQDYIHFPETLSMAPYSFVQPHLGSQCNTPLWGSTVSLLSSSFTNNGEFLSSSIPSGNGYGPGSHFPKNSVYRLLAVVVHSGEASTGHFVTYRRGPLRNSHRWYYTSDTVVREVSIDEVLSVPVYLLFYDRGAQRMNLMR